jgi:hypothetical protein
MSDLYDDDIALWSVHQADLLRRLAAGGPTNEIPANEIPDWANIAEEIESVGRSEKREVRSRLTVLICHLLKWAYQPEHQSASWRGTIRVQRRDLGAVLDDSPSLRGFAAGALPKAYTAGREDAVGETGILALPVVCPWVIDQILDEAFWP